VRGGALLALALAASPAGAIELSIPVDCVPGDSCIVQNHVDRDPGPGAADFTCGPLSYDGHKGSDFRLPDRAAMRAGIDVLAAAPGVVIGLRDGMPDIAQGDPGAPALDGRDCGNGVMLRHAGGWTTQYCHMARASLTVTRGARVERGQVLGRIGLSGRTEFPHLHFTVRDPQDRVIDPFDARRQNEACSFEDRETLWTPSLPYRAGGALAAGMAAGIPPYREVRDGRAHAPHLARTAPAIVVWAHFYGVRAGDLIVTRLIDPQGRPVAEDRHRMTRDRATQLRAVGTRNRGRLSPGRWQGRAVLMRDGRRHDSIETETRVE